MTVSIRRMTLGSGYKYLMGSVAQSDGASQHASALTRYYAESGTPPGRFIGRGLAGLGNGIGIEPGTQVTEEHLFRMLGMVQDPLTGEQLGRPPRAQKTPYGQRVSKRITAETAGLKGEEMEAKVLKIKSEERIAEAKIARAVAGFDLTFSAPKSVSVAWALADGGTQAVIYAAHQQALAYVLRYAEQRVFTSRSGKNGVVQEEIRGVVGAAFDHWDSRAGDPQLHTHVVVMNRAQSEDGAWRTLDSRGMFRATVGLSEMYNGVLSDFLTQALGWGWESTRRLHSQVPKYEVAGVPEELQKAFSTRSSAIEVATNALIPAFVASHGRSPNSREILRLRQRATLQTRPDKHVHRLSEQVDGWRKRAQVLLDTDPVPWVATLRDRNDLPLLRADDLTKDMLMEVGAIAVNVVAEKRSTFSRANVFAEVLRQIHGVRFTSADDRMAVVERTVQLALAEVLLISAPELAHTPARFTRPDGTSQFRARGFEVYTTQALLDAEARLLDAGRSTLGPRVAIGIVADVAGENLPGRAYGLSADQGLAIEQIATSGRVLDVLVGPAGTGKSTTMGGLRAVWERQFGAGTVVGLAPSAAAAQVLAEEFGVATENTSKWLTEQARQPARLREIDQLRAKLNRAGPSMSASVIRKRIDKLSAEVDQWSLRSGQLVVVDEASLAGTFALDTLTEQARNAGAKVVLVGDWAQLSAVEAGGAFHMLVHDRDLAPELADVRRFSHAWEKAASIDLRVGHPDAVDAYEEHDKIEGGERDSMLDLLYDAWRNDVAAGHQSLMIASDNDTVTALNERARAHRVALGEVRPIGIEIASGAVIGMGDLVVTRENNRLLSCGRGWVKNGDQWVVEEVAADGAVTVARTMGAGMPGGRQVVLPADYVRQHVELGYATTAHRAQGRTGETAHAFVSVTTQREVLYVAATRGRESNRLYVDTMYDPDADTQHGLPAEREAGDVLRQVLEARGADLSATETIAADWAEQHGIVRMWAEYDTIAGVAQRARYDELVTSSCSEVASEQVEGLRDSAAYGPLLAALREAEAFGLDVEHGLPRLVIGRTFSSADDVVSVLHDRVDRWVQASSPPRRVAANRIVGLFPRLAGVTDQDMARALDERQTLLEQRAREVVITAVEHQQPWASQLGLAPTDPVRREVWLRRLDTVAAYRERWGITDRAILGTREPTSLEQEAQRRLSQSAINGALSITRDERARVGAVGQAVDSHVSRGGPEM